MKRLGLATVCGALALLLPGGPPSRAADAATGADAAAQQAAALETVDRVLTRFAALVARDDDATHRAAAEATFGELKARRDALRANYDAGKYDELRVDLNLEYQRMSAWAAPARTPVPSGSAAPFAFSVFQLDPDPASPASVQTALNALDRELARQDERVKSTPAGPTRDALLKRLAAAQQGRTALARDFTKAAWAEVIRALPR